MSTRRRIGISAATTEAARRQLMQPVPCWEKVWVAPEGVTSSLKILKWVKTDKVPQFNDEVEADEPLAPLPDDEPEVIDADEDEDKDEKEQNSAAIAVVAATAEPAEAEVPLIETQEVDDSKVEEEPTTQLTLQPTEPDLIPEIDSTADVLDDSLKPPMDVGMQVDDSLKLSEETGMELDMSTFGPDGLGLEGAHDLSQMEPTDAIMGGAIMDDSVDPFAAPTADTMITQ